MAKAAAEMNQTSNDSSPLDSVPIRGAQDRILCIPSI